MDGGSPVEWFDLIVHWQEHTYAQQAASQRDGEGAERQEGADSVICLPAVTDLSPVRR